jgi:hypothetical protein
MSITHLNVRSADRVDQSSDTGSITVNLKNPIYKAKGVALAQAFIPNVLYNVSAALGNNQMRVTVSGTPYTVTVPDGNYTATTFATTLQALLQNAVANAWDVIFDTTTFLTTIAGTTAFTINFATVPGLATKLGWPAGMNVGPSTFITSPYVWNFSEPYCYYLRLNIPSNIVATSAAADTFNFVVPTNGNSGDMLTFAKNSDFDMVGQGGEFTINSLNISITDAYGKVVNMRRANWELILEIKYCCKDIPKSGCNDK